jgi:ferredoxin
VDFTRCVGCFNCLEVCPFSSAEYAVNPVYRNREQINTSSARKQHTTDTSKRYFLGGLILAFLGTTKISKSQEVVSYNATKPVKRNNPVSPPGAQTTERFNEACTACHLCVNVCPTHVLQPAVLEYGLRGLMQPRLDNFVGFCNYECILCSEVCPTGAILPLTVEDKKLTQMGKVQFVKENCIVETEGTDCGSCAEHCPTKAVRMVDYKDNIRIPEVNEDICIGCGACEYACPTKPYKAIYVEGNPVHVRAKKPKEEQVEKVEHEDDFPF